MAAQPQPVASMTGSGTSAGTTELGALRIEVRSVNGRGLVVKTRTGSGCGGFEAAIEERVRQQLVRGSVVVALERTEAAGVLGDRAWLRQLAGDLQALARDLGMSDELALRDLIALAQGLRQEPLTARELPPLLAALLDRALAELVRHRQEEGARTVAAMTAQLDELQRLWATAAARAPELVARHRERLLQRLNDFLAAPGLQLQPADVVREVALFADRIDVSEELQRLSSHLGEVRNALARGGEVGRRMEFLLQELLREANTLGSKSPDVTMAQTVVAMKTCIDRLKEQAANLE